MYSLLLAFFLSSGSLPTHAIYISVVEIERLENQTAKMQVKVFTDDFQDVMRSYADSKKLTFALEDSVIKVLAAGYFNDQLEVVVNRKQELRWKLTSSEQEADATFISFEAEAKASWSEVDIRAPFFTEIFVSQVNTFVVIAGEKKSYAKTSKKQPATSISLN